MHSTTEAAWFLRLNISCRNKSITDFADISGTYAACRGTGFSENEGDANRKFDFFIPANV
jgi:hypothetical protein